MTRGEIITKTQQEQNENGNTTCQNPRGAAKAVLRGKFITRNLHWERRKSVVSDMKFQWETRKHQIQINKTKNGSLMRSVRFISLYLT